MLIADWHTAHRKLKLAFSGWKSKQNRGPTGACFADYSWVPQGTCGQTRQRKKGQSPFLIQCVDDFEKSFFFFAWFLEFFGISQVQSGLVRQFRSTYYSKSMPSLPENTSHWKKEKDQPSNTDTEKLESHCGTVCTHKLTRWWYCTGVITSHSTLSAGNMI